MFYNMTNNTFFSKGWARATKIYPKSEEVIINCASCGSVGRYPKREFGVDIEGGTKYPDILLCGEYPLTIISEKVLEDWKKENITGYSYYKVDINNVFTKKLQTITPPQYFHIVINGRCNADLGKMKLKVKKTCRCGQVTFDKQLWEIKEFYLNQNTWDGSDLFITDFFSSIALCTNKILISACKNKHTNFLFVNAEDSMNASATPIDYLKHC